MNLKALCLSTLLLSTPLLAQEPTDFEALKKDQPKDVQTFIRRVFLSHHWTGEEPYGKKRAEQIKQAITKLKSNRLEADKARLRHQYQKKPKVLAPLNTAKNL